MDEEIFEMDQFSSLPSELLEKILSAPVLGAVDLYSFSRTCSVFAQVLDLNSLWRTKFKQRWPSLARKVVNFYSNCKKSAQIEWKSIYKHRLMVKKAVASHLVEIGRASYTEENTLQLAMNETYAYKFTEAESAALAEAVGSDARFGRCFMINELRDSAKRGHEWGNMTRKFYADKSVHCLAHDDLRPQIHDFLSSNSDNMDLEVGATLIAQWMQPLEDISLSDVKSGIDALAEDVKAKLHKTCPEHPMFLADVGTICLSPGDTTSRWSPPNCKAVLVAIEAIVSARFNQSFAQYAHPHKSYINCVLKDRQAIPITLCLILMGIARRLGFVLEPVSFPETFVLRWLEYPYKSGLARYTYVDPFHGRYSVTSEQLPSPYADRGVDGLIDRHVLAAMEQCSKREVILRMLRNLLNCWRQLMTRHEQRQTMLRHVVELECMAEPCNYQHQILMVQVMIQLGVNLHWAMLIVEELLALHPALTTPLSDIPIRCQHMLRQLKDKASKPREVQPKRRADHPQTVTNAGSLFDTYNQHFYVPNKYLAADYPDDTEACREIMKTYMKANENITRYWVHQEPVDIKSVP
ncbi:F-box only protein 21 [Elysia marginata]|uniref:F-box only protein 21 n=1 Tax=Elysia marginata TaxID=1093978 RepID=A0AAV4IJC1_9GAST|nr:F-box only protein 21 [Elysia marginata]